MPQQKSIYAFTIVHIFCKDFAEATGWQWTLAAEISALVVFAEHRGYGHSAADAGPFGEVKLGGGGGGTWAHEALG